MICIQTAQKEYVNFGLRLNISIFSLFLRGAHIRQSDYIQYYYIILYIYHKNEKVNEKQVTADVVVPKR